MAQTLSMPSYARQRTTREAESMRQFEEGQRERAEAAAAKERMARDKADKENAKLREQLDKARAAKAAPDPGERVDLLSGLLSRETLDKLSPEQIGEKMQTLFGERERRQHNIAGQIDLVIGQFPLCQRSCRLHRIRPVGALDEGKWLDTVRSSKSA